MHDAESVAARSLQSHAQLSLFFLAFPPSTPLLVSPVILIVWPPSVLVGVWMPAPVTELQIILSQLHAFPQYHTKSVSQRCYGTPAAVLMWPLGTAPRPSTLRLQACLAPVPVFFLSCLLIGPPRVLACNTPRRDAHARHLTLGHQTMTNAAQATMKETSISPGH